MITIEAAMESLRKQNDALRRLNDETQNKLLDASPVTEAIKDIARSKHMIELTYHEYKVLVDMYADINELELLDLVHMFRQCSYSSVLNSIRNTEMFHKKFNDELNGRIIRLEITDAQKKYFLKQFIGEDGSCIASMNEKLDKIEYKLTSILEDFDKKMQTFGSDDISFDGHTVTIPVIDYEKYMKYTTFGIEQKALMSKIRSYANSIIEVYDKIKKK